MRGVRELAGVSMVTVVMVRQPRSVTATVQRLRALAERGVARQRLKKIDAHDFNSIADIVRVSSLTEAQQAMGHVSRVVNLSGCAWKASVGSEAMTFELLWDGHMPQALGLQRASNVAPRDVLVRCTGADGRTIGVQRSVLTRTAATPAGDRRNASSRSVALLLRAISASMDGAARTVANGDPVSHNDAATKPSGVITAIAASVGVVGDALQRPLARTLRREDAWEIHYRTEPKLFAATGPGITDAGFKKYRAAYNRFVADPMPFSHDGIDAVFFEEFPYQTLKGVIACATLQPDGTLGASRCVLDLPYHLSYPFVFRDGTHVYMIPESSANRTVDLYECVSFPFEWAFRKTLLRNISANDATLHFDGKQWWMFATVSTEGAYAWDELHVFSAEQVLGEWHPHKQNPVKCDARSSRPAGPLFERGGQLLRPTQDCSASYGGAVNLCAIEVLSNSEFRERVVDRLDPSAFAGMNGLHTFAASGAIEVVDLRPERRWRWERATM